jgi:hemolysin activation/secretion protein
MGQGWYLRYVCWYNQLHESSSGWNTCRVSNTFLSVWIDRLGLSLVLLMLFCVRAPAQEQFGLFPPSRSQPEEPTLPKELPPAPLTRPQLPPIPPPSHKAPQAHLWLRQIRIEGNTVFSEQTLSQVAQPYLNRYVTSEDLEDLRQRLTRLYIDAGYVNSGAVLPDQTIIEGRVTFRIIEGALSSITFSGKRWFRDAYLRRRLTLDLAPPLNVNVLQNRIRRLQQDERIRRLDAELRPGIRRGESELHVELAERRPYSVELAFNNYQSPSVGAERGLITLADDNVTGRGDRWYLTFGRSAGLDLQIDTRYTLPLGPRDTSISLRYGRNQSNVIAEEFAFLDIESQSETWELSLRHPVYRDARREFALALSGKRAHSKTSLLGEPTSLSAGVEDGVANVTTLSWTSEWLDQGPNAVLAV